MAIVTKRWDGMRWTRQHRVRLTLQGELILVSNGRCIGRAVLQRFRQGSAGSTWLVEGLAEEAADGEVVWAWHPLLMLSLRRFCGPDRVRQGR